MTAYAESVLVRLTERQARLLRLAAAQRGKSVEQIAKLFLANAIEDYAARLPRAEAK